MFGGYGVMERNGEWQMVVDFTKRMAVVNRYFSKREDRSRYRS